MSAGLNVAFPAPAPPLWEPMVCGFWTVTAYQLTCAVIVLVDPVDPGDVPHVSVPNEDGGAHNAVPENTTIAAASIPHLPESKGIPSSNCLRLIERAVRDMLPRAETCVKLFARRVAHPYFLFSSPFSAPSIRDFAGCPTSRF